MPSVLLFTGLPLDVREQDLAELLTAEPTRLAPANVAVTALYNGQGTFLGTFLVEVAGEAEAERVRRQFSGQVIDGSHTLAVHHVLPATMAHPSQAAPARTVIPPFGSGAGAGAGAHAGGRRGGGGGGQAAPAFTPAPPKPTLKTGGRAPGPAGGAAPLKAAVKKDDNTKPPGLKLLGRLGKGGKAGEKERQKLLLEKQRMALARSRPGDALLSRLAKNPQGSQGSPVTKRKGKAAAAAAAGKGKKGVKPSDKIARAKKGASSAMDVDKSVPAAAPAAAAAPKKPKTQAELDEEMKAYERQRRFAAA